MNSHNSVHLLSRGPLIPATALHQISVFEEYHALYWSAIRNTAKPITICMEIAKNGVPLESSMIKGTATIAYTENTGI